MTDELLREMWRDCADDLRRWAKAFSNAVGLPADPASGDALERLAREFEAKADATRNHE